MFHHQVKLNSCCTLALLILLVLPSVMCSQPGKTRYQDLIKPKNAVYYHVPIGLCEDYPEETTTMQLCRDDMELLKRTGISLLRISFGWDAIEAKKDTLTWLFWDDFVKMAVDEYGITLIPYICYTPRWNSDGDSNNYWNRTPKDYEAFGRFVSALVNRYKPWIHSWELWNEPDIQGVYWSGTAEDLARLTKIGAEAVKKADPGAIVVLAGLAGKTEFTNALFKDYGISRYVDVVNCHNYYETWNPNPLEQIVPYIHTLSDIIRKYGSGQSLWMAEVGYSTFRRPGGYVSDWTHTIYDYEHTLKFQAVQLVRTITLALSTNELAALAWYEVKDLPPDEKVIGDINNRHLGVGFADHRPKPAEKALSFVNNLFSKKNRCIDDSVMIVRTIGSESEVHCFQNDDGSMIVVGWIRTHGQGRTPAGPAGNLKDSREEIISLTLPADLQGNTVIYNEIGDGKPFRQVRHAGMSTTLDNITLEGGEVVIITIDK